MPCEPIHLTAGGTSLILDVESAQAMPIIRHWGAAVPAADDQDLRRLLDAQRPPRVTDQIDDTPELTLLPEQSRAWYGEPGLDLTERDGAPITRLHRTGTTLTADEDGTQRLTITAQDADAERLSLRVDLEMLPTGLIRQCVTLTSHTVLDVRSVTPTLPVPAYASELMDLVGRHLRERHPQRLPFAMGAHRRATTRGRTSLQSATLIAAGTTGFTFETGEVWAVHLGWSGDQQLLAERHHTGHRTLAGGELLHPGEMVLQPGDAYTTPWTYFAHGTGLNAIGDQFTDAVRRIRPPEVSSRPRPVTLNTWEAVYFNHDLDVLRELADHAASIGVERFVLDDGWFSSRRDDRAGLGDWTVSPDAWPSGLGPLINHVRCLGMEFGIWIEPEMVNPDSDLARAHPDWILGQSGRLPVTARNQLVLDLANPAAYAHIAEQLAALLDEHQIAYLKWDHNRDLLEPISPRTGRVAVHEQTRAAYWLMDQLRAHQEGLEIEACASGGGRIDLGVLEHTDRVWTSDCIDPIERDTIQRYTSLIVPPEMMGAHVGAARSHTTGRNTSLHLRATSAFSGHFGIEWDLREASESERAELSAVIAEWKQWRDHLAASRTVRADDADSSRSLTGHISSDRRRSLWTLLQRTTSDTYPSPPMRVPGLDPELQYRVQLLGDLPEGAAAPPWIREGLSLPGRLLSSVGVSTPTLHPGTACRFTISADSSQ